MKDIFEIIGALAIVVLFFVVSPFIYFWLSYFVGWITMHVIGVKLAMALNILFNTSYFTPQMLPMLSGALGWLGGFFKSVTNIKNNK